MNWRGTERYAHGRLLTHSARAGGGMICVHR